MKRATISNMVYDCVMKRIFLFIICSIISFQYISVLAHLPIIYWLHYTEKPFVYRCLLPLLANNNGIGIHVLISLSCSGLILAMLYVYEKYWEQSLRNDIAVIVIYFLITLILTRFSNYYDFPSTFFFLILFILFNNKKYFLSAIIFILACLNRETAIILVAVLLLMSRKISLAAVFMAEFLITRFLIVYAFSDAPGQPAYNNLLANLAFHAKLSTTTIIMITIGLGIIASVILNSLYLPKNILIFIGAVLPALLAVYLIFGIPTEIRVFAEVMPLLLMSAFMKPRRVQTPKDEFCPMNSVRAKA
jgi:hypothetical protein